MSINLEEWDAKLTGKAIVPIGGQVTNPETEFAEEAIRDAVPEYRILKPDSMMTRDFREDRINVHVTESDNVVERVSIG